jgi:hypothetical protein
MKLKKGINSLFDELQSSGTSQFNVPEVIFFTIFAKNASPLAVVTFLTNQGLFTGRWALRR